MKYTPKLLFCILSLVVVTDDRPYGFVPADCEPISKSAVEKVYCSRPLPHTKTVNIWGKMDMHRVTEGRNAWPGDAKLPNREITTYDAGYYNSSSGADSGLRDSWFQNPSNIKS